MVAMKRMLLAVILCLSPAMSIACMRPQPEFMAKGFNYVDLLVIDRPGKIKEVGDDDYLVTAIVNVVESSSHRQRKASATWSFRRLGGLDTCTHTSQPANTDVRGYYLLLRKSDSLAKPMSGQSERQLFGPYGQEEAKERFDVIRKLIH
jgi:hypothetical protein